MSTETKYQQIDKEAVSGLHFPDDEILLDHEAQHARLADLQRALALGNLEHSKIKIYFADNTSAKVVDTTVWGLTDKRVILKQGVVIPIHRVLRVKF
jgi:uncharacterized protein (UPF0248 family)